MVGYPALAPDGSIYVGGCHLLALSPDGTLKWKTDSLSEGCPYGDLIIGPDGKIYGLTPFLTPSEEEAIAAVNPDGSLRWVIEAARGPNRWEKIVSQGAISHKGDRIYFPLRVFVDAPPYEGFIIWKGLNADDGSTAWEQTLDDYRLLLSSTPPTILPDGTILAAVGTDPLFADMPFVRLLSFNSDGTLKQAIDAKLPRWGDTVYMLPLSLVLSEEGVIYFASRDFNPPDSKTTGGTLYAFDPSGSILWYFPFEGAEITTEPVLGTDGTIYIGTFAHFGYLPWESTLYAIAPNGELKWKFSPLTDESWPIAHITGAPAVGRDGVIYLPVRYSNPDVHRGPGKLYALSEEGEVLWEFETIGEILSPPVLAEDGTLYFITIGPCVEWDECENRLYALQTSSPGLADSPWPMYRGDPQHSGQVHITTP